MKKVPKEADIPQELVGYITFVEAILETHLIKLDLGLSAETRERLAPNWKVEVPGRLDRMLQTLTPTEQHILRTHYGIGRKKKTLKEVGGNGYVLSASRAAQYKRKALNHLRNRFWTECHCLVKWLNGEPVHVEMRLWMIEIQQEVLNWRYAASLCGGDYARMQFLMKPASEIASGFHTRKVFEHEGIQYVYDLVQLSEEVLRECKQHDAMMIRRYLSEQGLGFNMKPVGLKELD